MKLKECNSVISLTGENSILSRGADCLEVLPIDLDTDSDESQHGQRHQDTLDEQRYLVVAAKPDSDVQEFINDSLTAATKTIQNSDMDNLKTKQFSIEAINKNLQEEPNSVV